jgi:oligopeptidase B
MFPKTSWIHGPTRAFKRIRLACDESRRSFPVQYRLHSTTCARHRPCPLPLLPKHPLQREFHAIRWFSLGAPPLTLTDPYDEYRQGITPHLLGEMQFETLQTKRRIDQNLYQELLQELQNAAQHQPIPPLEQGPIGTWKYRFSVVDGDRRQYQRTLEDSTQQVVVELQAEDEILSMSLTVDESCIACLSENVVKGTRDIRLSQIETGRQSVLTMDAISLESLEWGPIQPNGRHSLYLVGSDAQGRPDRVYVSIVDPTSMQATQPIILFQSDDPAVMVDVQRTKGCQYVAIQAMTKTSNEIYLSSDPSLLLLVIPRQGDVQYHLDVGEKDDIVILMSENGGEYSAIETSIDALPIMDMMKQDYNDRKIQTDDDHVIMDMDLFQSNLVLYENSTLTGTQRITVHERGAKPTYFTTIPLPSGNIRCRRVSPTGNIHYGATSLRFEVESPATPGLVYEYNFATKEVKSIGSENTETQTSFKTERLFVPSKDGTKVPLSVMYRDDQETSFFSWFGTMETARPVVLVGYGAYGEPMNLGFDPTWLPLLERGYVLAFAHSRGGGDLGKAWYHAGRREHKEKAIEDLEACGNYLKSQWGGTLTCKAFSAGGVIVGAAMNRHPELFDKVVLTNAFLDVYTTMMNPGLFLTPHEWDEYGNPLEDSHIQELIQSYCPISNVASSTNSYSRVLLIGTVDDENVPFWNAAIFAKKLRDRMENEDRIFLHIEDSGGHHFRSRRLQVAALELAFIIQNDSSVRTGEIGR